MTVSKICANQDCQKVFYKKNGLQLFRWKQQKYCSRQCQIDHKNKLARAQNTLDTTREQTRLNCNHSADHSVIRNFLCKYAPPKQELLQ